MVGVLQAWQDNKREEHLVARVAPAAALILLFYADIQRYASYIAHQHPAVLRALGRGVYLIFVLL